ncbi:undecaprenyl-diphosphate phosphatase [bacterium]|nr:undecaprenyl-diphosphate phosphatase [bacterium]
MTHFEAFLYGMVQGLTEYLPVSSSAHLVLLPRVLKHADPGLAFDVFLHLGTLLATLYYFRKDWVAIWKTLPPPFGTGKKIAASPLPWHFLVMATIPALAVGYIFHHAAETVFRSNWITAATMATGGILLYCSDQFFSRRRNLTTLQMRDILWVGACQCLAIIPGFSRSGSTIMGGRFLGFDRASAARLSFLMSMPVTAAAVVYEMRKWHELASSTIGLTQLVVAGVSAFVFGILAIGGLLKLVKTNSFLGFVIYRLGFAVAVLWAFGLY